MYRLSLAPTTVGSIPATEMVRVSAAAGFDALALRLRPPPTSGDAEDGTPIAEIRGALSDSGLALLSLNAMWLSANAPPSEYDRFLDAAAELGAEHCQVIIVDPEFDRALASFSRYAELAAARNLRLAIEFKDDSPIKTIGDAARFTLASGQSNVGICLDALHLSRTGGSPDDLAGIDPQSIHYLEISDAPAALPPSDKIRTESRSHRMFPGHGGLWLNELLDALRRDITVHVEAPGAAPLHLSAADKARAAALHTRRFLATRPDSGRA